MGKSELNKLLTGIKGASISVIGDYCLDSYWFVNSDAVEKSVETGIDTRPVEKQKYSLGGAGNVVMNLVSLGVKKVNVFGVIGNDLFGREMSCLLNGNKRISTKGLLSQEKNWDTHVYSKPYLNDNELNRIDFGRFNKLCDGTAEKLINILEKSLTSSDVVIINEQVESGIHNSSYFRKLLSSLIKKHSKRIFLLDSRHYSNVYSGTIRKLNETEAARLCGLQRTPGDKITYSEAKDCLSKLWRKWKKPLLLTRGDRGCFIMDGSGFQDISGLLITSRVDPVGAGDSMLAGTSAALATGAPLVKAAELGNFTAGVTVQKLFQTGTASPDEILAIGSEPDYIYRPEIAEGIRFANYFSSSEIEIVTEFPNNPRFKHAIFDHDGTISTLRQGWEKIMEPMMILAILGDHMKNADEYLYNKALMRVRDFIDKTTGIQTITQMEGLEEIVREFRCVPEKQILSPAGYKKIYNLELMKLVKNRIEKLDRGELETNDFAIKNAIAFLHKLHGAGITMFLASGTDEEDVINEAKAMGYANLFKGGICGSKGISTQDAKKIVLERILKEVGHENSSELIAFGDGPVEIRETHKRGGFTVGIASDEIRRFGLNTEKRTRLIKAGADIVIQDFSQMNILLPLLGIK